MDISYLWTAFTYATIIGLAGIGALVWKMTLPKNKKDSKKIFAWLGFALLVVAFIPVTGYGMGLTTPINFGGVTTVSVAPTQPLSTGQLCAVEDTTVTLSGIDNYTSTATGGTHRYRLNSNPALTVSDAGVLTASPGDKLEILWMNGSETDSAYFSAVSTEIVPCKGTVTFSKELVKNSTVTIDVFNEDGDKIDTANNETLAAGDVTTLVARMKGQFQKGQIYGGIVVCDWNSTAFDDCIVDFGGTEVNVPQIYNPQSNRNVKAYSIPAFTGTEILDGSVTLDVDDTNAIAAVPEAAVNLTYYPNDYFINEDLGGIYDGPAVEDEDDTQTKAYSVVSDIVVTP